MRNGRIRNARREAAPSGHLKVLAALQGVAALAVAFLAVATAGACGERGTAAPQVEVRDAWVRAATLPESPGPGGVNSAAYFTLSNSGGVADRLVGVDFAGARRAEMHETVVDSLGVARMRPVEAVDVPAGGEARFEPGGLHVMLMGLQSSLAEDDTVVLELRFEASGPVSVRAPVRRF